MPMTATFANNLLKYLFQNVALANIGDATGLAATASPGGFYISLHTANPGETGDQSTSEITINYVRIFYGTSSGSTINSATTSRSSANWSVTGNSVSLIVPTSASAYVVYKSTGSAEVVTHWGLGSSQTGAGTLFYYGPLTASITMDIGRICNFGSITITES